MLLRKILAPITGDIPVTFPHIIKDCGDFSIVAIGFCFVRVSNAVIQGLGLPIATDLAKRHNSEN